MEYGKTTMLGFVLALLSLAGCSYDTDKFSQDDAGSDGDGGDAGDDAQAPVTCSDGTVTADTSLHLFIRGAKDFSRHDVWVFVNSVDSQNDSQYTLTATERYHGIADEEVDNLDTLEFFIPRALLPGRNVVRVYFDLNDDHVFTKKGEDANLAEAEPGFQIAPCSDGSAEIDMTDPPPPRGDLNDPIMDLSPARFTAEYTGLNSSHTGQFFELRLYDDETNRVVVVDHIAQVPSDGTDITTIFEGALQRNHTYTAQMVADVNGDGQFSKDDFDHHWVRTVEVTNGDGTLVFPHTGKFEKVNWEVP